MNSRSKRGLFDFIGDISKYLFGTATSEIGSHGLLHTVLPKPLRPSILEQLHDSVTAGYLGIKKTKESKKDLFGTT